MAQFDIIAAAGKAYITSWNERRYLFRLAVVPFLVKTFCYMLAFSMGYQENQLALTLFLVPACFLEGWMLSHYVRLLILGHRWPFRPTGNFDADLPILQSRARGIMSGTLSYILINMAMGGIMAFLIAFVPMPDMGAEGYDPASAPAYLGPLMLALLIFLIWAFRLVWVYIPMASNIEARFYIRAFKGYMSSLPLIGIWLICIMPFFMVVRLVGGLIHEILSAGGSDALASFALVLLMVAMDTVKNLVATAGVTYGMMEVFEKQGKVDFRA